MCYCWVKNKIKNMRNEKENYKTKPINLPANTARSGGEIHQVLCGRTQGSVSFRSGELLVFSLIYHGRLAFWWDRGRPDVWKQQTKPSLVVMHQEHLQLHLSRVWDTSVTQYVRANRADTRHSALLFLRKVLPSVEITLPLVLPFSEVIDENIKDKQFMRYLGPHCWFGFSAIVPDLIVFV